MASPAVASGHASSRQATILWDTWGVPHIFAQDDADLFYAFGQAQMQNHADLLLSLYGQARGRAAEYWGAQYLPQDELLRTLGLPEHAQQWYNAQSPEFRGYLQAFVAGMNNYATHHPGEIAPQDRVVLPITVTDVMAHGERVLSEFLSGDCSSVFGGGGGGKGSNGWAIGPGYASGGHAMLLANPHLPWGNEYTFFEAQLVSPSMNAYGATLVGFPVLAIAFSSFLSWTHTVNPLDSCDRYLLTLSGNGYLYNGQQRAFDTHTETLLVKQSDGSLTQQSLVIRRSVQGPVFFASQGGQQLAIATRFAGIDQFPAYGIWQEWWDMARAHNLAEFQKVVSRLQLPVFNILYAGRDGHVMYLFNGDVPRRPSGDVSYWNGVIPGDTSQTLWNSFLTYQELPKVIDPPGGWVQNANSPPWVSSFPQVLNPAAYPAYLAPQDMSLREQRGVRMITEHGSLSFDNMVEDIFSTHMEMADRLLDGLISAARTYGNATAQQAADVLQGWDRTANAESTGAILFQQWVFQMYGQGLPLFAQPWDPAHPLTTPSGLANPQVAAAALGSAANAVIAQYGSLTVPWGSVYRLQRGSINLPASGGLGDLGIFSVLDYTQNQQGQFAAAGGDSYMAAVEFSTPVRAKVLLIYGNASQPDSPHNGDQLALYAHQQMRDAWLTLPEIQQHLAAQETVSWE